MNANKMPEEMLAEFDAAFRAKFGCGVADVAAARNDEGMAMMGGAMWAWQASREAVEVKLPLAMGGRMWVSQVVESITAQGLKVAE